MQKKELPADVCLEPFPADPGFPQLRIATDPELMLGVFREHLRPLPGRLVRIEKCSPVRFRCRPSSSRCVLQYALRVVEGGTESHCHPWVTVVIYAEPGRAEERWAELKAAGSWRQIPETLLAFEPLVFIGDLQMLVEVFPFDPRLPNLPLAMT